MRDKQMTFKQALGKLNRIALSNNRDYFAMKYEVVQKCKDLVDVECWMYVADAGWFRGPSWTNVLEQLEKHYSAPSNGNGDGHGFTLIEAPEKEGQAEG